MRILAAAIALLLSSSAFAQNVPFPYRNALGPQYNITITSATALTVPVLASYGVICALGGALMYTTDGATAPTSSVGLPVASGSCVGLPATLLATFKAIGTTLAVEYYK